MSTFESSRELFNQYHFTVVEIDLPVVEGIVDLTTSVEDAAPTWYWKLDESTGLTAVNRMGSDSLTYESNAIATGYSIPASNNDSLGLAKDINGDSTRQIYDIGETTVGTIDPPTDYKAYWNMNDASGNFLDSSGNSHTATANGTPAYGETGQVDDAILFDGSTDYGTIVDHADLKPTSVTVCGWVKTSMSGSVGMIAQNQLLHTGGTLLSGWFVQITSGGKIIFYIADNTGVSYSANASSVLPQNDNNWHHFCGTYDGSDIKMYIDGVLTDESSIASGLAYQVSTHYCQIGAWNQTGTVGSYFNGTIDELKIFDYALTETNITDIFQTDGGILYDLDPPTDYEAYWNMDDAQVSGSTMLDLTANDHDATMVNTPTTGETGKVGEAVTFNGTNEYMTVVDVAALKPTNLTVCAWVKVGTLTAANHIMTNFSTNGSLNMRGWRFYLDATDAYFEVADNTGNVASINVGRANASRSLDGGWHHYVGVHDGSEVHLYIDGVLSISVPWTNGADYTGCDDPTIGARTDGFTNIVDRYFNGSIDDLKFYDYAITATQVRDIFLSDGGRQREVQDYVARWELENIVIGRPITGAGPTDYEAYWTMDDAQVSGSTMLDLTANNHDATMVNTPTTGETGKVGEAVLFDGSTEYMTLVNSAALRPANVSVSVWVKSTSNGGRQSIFQSFAALGGNWAGIRLGLSDGSNCVVFDVGKNTGYGYGTHHDAAYNTSIPILDGQWHHICGTYDGATIKLYQDGALISSVAWVGLVYQATNYVLIGSANSDGTVASYFNGTLDELKFFDYALTEQEVINIYGINASYPNDYIAEWKLDSDGSDTTGNHDATPVGSPTYVTGFVDNACSLNGTNQYYTITNHADLRPTNVTVCAWVKTVEDNVYIFQSSRAGNITTAGFTLVVAGGEVRFMLGSDTGIVNDVDRVVVYSTSTVADGEWHHVAGTWDGSDSKVYVDGVLEATKSYTGALAYNATNYVQIGRYWDGTVDTAYFNGNIDGVKVFGYAASADQVADLSRIAVDSTYSKHQGTIYNNPISTLDNGVIGQAITFDGLDDYIALPDDADLRPTTLTISAWVKTNDLSSIQGIFSNWETNPNNAGFLFGLNSSGKVRFMVAKNTGTSPSDYDQAVATTTLTIDTYAHVVGTYDGTDIKIYVNGVLEDTVTFAAGLVYDSPSVVQIGSREDTTFGHYQFFNGTIDDVRLYDRAITQAEVSVIYASRLAAPPEDFVAEWTFDDISGTTINETLNNHDATAVNTPTYDAGWEGDCITLNGSTQYATVVDDAALKSANVSVACWRKSSVAGGYIAQSASFSGDYAGWLLSPTRLYIRSNTGTVLGVDYDYSPSAGLSTDGEWHHICGTYDGTTITIYRDGVNVGETAYAGGLAYDTPNYIAIGAAIAAGTPTGYFNGSIDSLKIYDRSLSADEVVLLAQYTEIPEATGTESVTTYPDDIGVLSTADFTIECAFAISTATTSMQLMGKVTDTIEWSIRLGSADANTLVFELYETGDTSRETVLSSDLSSDGVTANDAWHWLSIRMDHTTTELLTCEIDGTETLSTSVTSWSGSWRKDEDSGFCIGADGHDGANIWNGYVDEVAIYKKAITTVERDANYDWWSTNTTSGAIDGYGTPLSSSSASTGDKTYKFTDGNAPNLSESGILRIVDRIKETTAKLNPHAGLSSRGNGSVTMVDIKGDPNPWAPEVTPEVIETGTFLAKMNARNIMVNKPLRIKNYRMESDGTVDLSSGAETRHYLIESFEFMGNDKWSLKFKDELSRVNIDETTWPLPAEGYLRSGITLSTTTIPVDANITYLVGDTIRIGDELMKVSGVADIGTGSATLTVNTRGSSISYTNTLSTTTAEEHEADDEVFVCDVCDNEDIDVFLKRVLTDIGIDSSYITDADWAAEIADWHPTDKINTLWIESLDTSEVLEQVLGAFLLDMWFDPVGQKVRLTAISQWKESSATISEGDEIDYDTVKRKKEENLRVTRGLVVYDKRNLTATESVENYNKAALYTRSDLEAADFYGEAKTKRFGFSRLLSKNAAALLVNRYVSRNEDPKTYQWITQERKLNYSVGDVLNVVTDADVGFNGSKASGTRAQISQVQPKYTKLGREYAVTALSYQAAADSGSETVISGYLYNIDLHTYIGAPIEAVTVTIVIDGATVGSTDTAVPSIVAGNFAAGSKIILILANGADICGKGGEGGRGQPMMYDDESSSWWYGTIGNGKSGGDCYDAQGIDTDIYFSGATTSVDYATADGYIRAPNGGDGGFIHVGTVTGNGGDGGDGIDGGAGGLSGHTFGGGSATRGVDGAAGGYPTAWGQDGANNGASGGSAGGGVIDSSATVTFYGSTVARYVDGNGDH
ncbi:MAG: LamG domain-containing protein [Gammaproteobacteria bacterium]|nr:LamG domain-containing protein [Gammaproteobacteria bacterium]